MIAENSGTPLWKVSALYWIYGYYGLIHLTNFKLITYYWVYMLEYIPSTKNNKQDSRGTICCTVCEQWTAEKFDGQANRWYQDWFSVEIWPVLKLLSWSVTVPIIS